MAHTSGTRQLLHISSLLICICSISTLAVATPKDRPKDIHLQFYGCETRDGPNTTLLLLGEGSKPFNLSAVGFGSILVFDNILRWGPNTTDKEIGRHQGTAIGESLDPVPIGGLYMQAQHIFQEGSGSLYNGSSITVMGTVANQYLPYQLLVPGGLGYFLGCTGYALCGVAPSTTPPLFVFSWDLYLKCT